MPFLIGVPSPIMKRVRLDELGEVVIFTIYVSLASIEKFISFLEYFYLSEADVGVNVVFIGVRRLPLE